MVFEQTLVLAPKGLGRRNDRDIVVGARETDIGWPDGSLGPQLRPLEGTLSRRRNHPVCFLRCWFGCTHRFHARHYSSQVHAGCAPLPNHLHVVIVRKGRCWRTAVACPARVLRTWATSHARWQGTGPYTRQTCLNRRDWGQHGRAAVEERGPDGAGQERPAGRAQQRAGLAAQHERPAGPSLGSRPPL